MDRDQPDERGHESLDHEDPSTAGPMAPPEAVVPGTGIFGDETLVRDAGGAPGAGIYPAAPSGTGGEAKPGPTPEGELDDLGRTEATRFPRSPASEPGPPSNSIPREKV